MRKMWRGAEMLSQAGDTLPWNSKNNHCEVILKCRCAHHKGTSEQLSGTEPQHCQVFWTLDCKDYGMTAMHGLDLIGITLPYFKTIGCTGNPAKKAPVLKGKRKLPFVVVPCMPHKAFTMPFEIQHNHSHLLQLSTGLMRLS